MNLKRKKSTGKAYTALSYMLLCFSCLWCFMIPYIGNPYKYIPRTDEVIAKFGGVGIGSMAIIWVISTSVSLFLIKKELNKRAFKIGFIGLVIFLVNTIWIIYFYDF